VSVTILPCRCDAAAQRRAGSRRRMRPVALHTSWRPGRGRATTGLPDSCCRGDARGLGRRVRAEHVRGDSAYTQQSRASLRTAAVGLDPALVSVPAMCARAGVLAEQLLVEGVGQFALKCMPGPSVVTCRRTVIKSFWSRRRVPEFDRLLQHLPAMVDVDGCGAALDRTAGVFSPSALDVATGAGEVIDGVRV